MIPLGYISLTEGTKTTRGEGEDSFERDEREEEGVGWDSKSLERRSRSVGRVRG